MKYFLTCVDRDQGQPVPDKPHGGGRGGGGGRLPRFPRGMPPRSFGPRGNRGPPPRFMGPGPHRGPFPNMPPMRGPMRPPFSQRGLPHSPIDRPRPLFRRQRKPSIEQPKKEVEVAKIR